MVMFGEWSPHLQRDIRGMVRLWFFCRLKFLVQEIFEVVADGLASAVSDTVCTRRVPENENHDKQIGLDIPLLLRLNLVLIS